jgi:hypothetical protein
MRQGYIRPGKTIPREIMHKRPAGATAANSYDPSILRRSSQNRWINGERECATGQPMTHALVCREPQISRNETSFLAQKF